MQRHQGVVGVRALRLLAGNRGRGVVSESSPVVGRTGGRGEQHWVFSGRWVSSRGTGDEDDGDQGKDKPRGSSVWNFLTGGSSSSEDQSAASTSRAGRDDDRHHDDIDDGHDDSGSGSGNNADSSSSSHQLIPSRPEDRYREVIAIPIARRPLFPGVIMPTMVTDTRVIKELIDVRKQGAQAYVGAFLGKGGHGSGEDEGDGDMDGISHATRSVSDLASEYEVGTFAQVHTVVPHEQGAQLLLLGHRRIRRTGVASTSPLKYRIDHIRDEAYNKSDDMLKASTLELISTVGIVSCARSSLIARPDSLTRATRFAHSPAQRDPAPAPVV